jgi:hypothetical protein
MRIEKLFINCNMKNIAFILLIGFCFYSCSDDLPLTGFSLETYIDHYEELALSDELIACAAGGQSGILDDEIYPISVLYYPLTDAEDIRYYETEDLSADPEDLSSYEEVSLPSEGLFDGFLGRFLLTNIPEDKYVRVSFKTIDTLWYSMAIQLRTNEKPSIYNPNLCAVDLSDKFQPILTWEEGNSTENIIFFQLLVSENNKVYSGTYTEDLNFQYYDVSNVVFNVTRIEPVPSLGEGEQLRFVLMGIGSDNWVNLISDISFTVE